MIFTKAQKKQYDKYIHDGGDVLGSELWNRQDLYVIIHNLLTKQPCGHPLSAIVHNGTTSYCGSCADDSLRANIAAGVEA